MHFKQKTLPACNLRRGNSSAAGTQYEPLMVLEVDEGVDVEDGVGDGSDPALWILVLYFQRRALRLDCSDLLGGYWCCSSDGEGRTHWS